MRAKSFVFGLLCVFSFAISGCDSPQNENQIPEPDGMIKFGSPTQHGGFSGPPSDAFADQGIAFFEAARSASSLSEADRKIRKLLHDTSSVAQPLREQMAAFAMFANYFEEKNLLKREMSEEELSILGFYTDLFVENRSPEAALVLPALEKLRGTWSEEKVASAAQAVAQAAKSQYDSTDSNSVNLEGENRTSEVLRAASRLTRLADTLQR